MSEHDDHADLPVAARVRRLEERLIGAGLASDAEIDEFLRRLYREAGPVNGARMVARAWTDPDYRARLLADGNAAGAELGFGWMNYQLRVVANTAAIHNVIVCTLCSCYPVTLLGPSPGWYKSFAYRSRTVREPRAVLAEFGVSLGPDVSVSVWDSTSEARYMVLPLRPAGTDGLGPDQLARLVTLNGLIGTALVLPGPLGMSRKVIPMSTYGLMPLPPAVAYREWCRREREPWTPSQRGQLAQPGQRCEGAIRAVICECPTRTVTGLSPS